MRSWFKQKYFIALLAGLVALVAGRIVFALAKSCLVNTCQADYTTASGILVIDGSVHLNFTVLRIAEILIALGLITSTVSGLILAKRAIFNRPVTKEKKA